MKDQNRQKRAQSMTLMEYIWRNSYQLVGWEEEHAGDVFPDVFGCGFVLKLGTKFIFVTADHVIHKADETAGERTNITYKYAIVCNHNIVKDGSLQTLFRPIGGFISLDRYNFGKYLRGEEELDVAFIPDMQDYAFADFNPEYFKEIFTPELKNKENVLVKEGLFKIHICEKTFVEPNSNSKYIVAGTMPHNYDGIKWIRANAIHRDLIYIGKEQEMYKFSYPAAVKYSEWEGLSGSAFFDYEGNLVGMLLRAVEEDNIVWVMPITTIWKMINQMVRIGQL